MDNAMDNESLLEDELEEKWDIECPEFPNKIFSYKGQFKNIGYLKDAAYISKLLYKPSLLTHPENKPPKCYIAVKKLEQINDKRKTKNIIYEIKSLMMLEQKKTEERIEINIIRLYGYTRENGFYLLYMEWMDFSLRDLYTKGIKQLLLERTLNDKLKNKLNTLIGYITVEIIDALCYLCSCEKPIIHRDVKPENILLSYAGKVKLADFGEARFGNTKTTGGTIKYRPPEAFQMDEVDGDELQKYDVFSLGVVVLEYFCVMHSYDCRMLPNDYIYCEMHPYDYIKKLQSGYADTAEEGVLAEEGELTKWSEKNSVFTKNKLINDDNFQNFLSLSLQPIKARATPLELQQNHFYRVHKEQNEDPCICIAAILNELQIHPVPNIISSHQTRKFLSFILFGFFLLAIILAISIGAMIFLNNAPITECEKVGGKCMEKYENECEGDEKMLMQFSCPYHTAKCCVDAKEMAKIDSPNWQNNCGCGPDEEPSDSVCIYEVPNGTKRLEEELHAKFPSLIKTFSENIICGPKSNFKAKRAIVINSKWIYEEFERVNWTQTIMHWKSIVEKKRRVVKFIYYYLIHIVTGKSPCTSGIEKVTYWGETNETTYIWYSNLTTPLKMPGNATEAHITIILNSCGSKYWGSAKTNLIFNKSENKTKEVQDGDDDDRHKPEGVIMLEIDRFNEFMDKPLFTYQLPSQPVYIRGLPWKIIASPTAQWITRMDRKHFPICKGEKALGFYLQCNDDVSDPSWSCTAEAILRVHSQTAGIEDYTKWIVHTFNAKENSRGYSEFMTCETLADPANGYLKNDTIKLSVQVWADAPQGVQ